MKKILMAVDGGPLTEAVIQHGIELANATNAETGIIYVADPTGFMGDGGYNTKNYLDDLHKEARELFERIQSEFGIKGSWTFIKDGKPASKIVETANEWKADYIVIATHGRTGISHLLMSSVAEHVIRHSTVPVLVITPEHK
jgi:nucleotide-binding universal stress UspA family protein